MRSVPTKITGNTYTATEFNELMSQELQNSVLTSGQILTAADLNQLGKAMSVYGSAGDFYTDAGTANTYVLTPIGTPARQTPPSYTDGVRVRFVVGNTNTGASTINLNSLGVKSIKENGGAAVPAGRIVAGSVVEAVFLSTPDEFQLVDAGSITQVNLFGAKGDGIADDTASIQAAIDGLPSQGGIVLFSRGTYRITSLITIGPRITLIGEGANATRLNCATGLSPFKFIELTPSNVFEGGGMRGFSISLDNAAIGIECIDIWGLKFEQIRFRDGGTTTGTLIKGSGICFEMRVIDCRLVGSNNFGIDLIDDCNSSYISRNDFALKNGATSIRLKDTADCAVVYNRFEYAGADAGTKVEVDDSVRTVIKGNLIQVSTSGFGIVLKGVGTGADRTTISSNGFAMTGSAGAIDVITGDFGAVDSNNFLVQSTTGDMIRLGGRFGYSFTGNTFEINANYVGSTILFDALAATCSVNGNTWFGLGAGSGKGTAITIPVGAAAISITGNSISFMDKGIDSDVTSATPSVTIIGNSITSMTTSAVEIALASSNIVTNNVGFITQNKSTDLIGSAATSVVITHGLDLTPAAEDINITSTNDPTNAVGNVFVTAITSTQFTVNIENVPGVSTFTFGWNVNVI